MNHQTSRLIAFWSPSHAGASTLLLNVAAALSARRAPLVAADFNLVTPSLALYADALPYPDPLSACLSRLMPAIEGGRLTAEDLMRRLLPAPGFPVLPGMLDVALGSRFAESHVQALLQALLGRFDLVLADVTPALDSAACLPILEAADLICLVVGPEIASRFHSRRHILPLRGTGLDQKLALVVTRANGAVAREIAEEMELPAMTAIPDLPAMTAMLDAGRIAFQTQPVLPATGRFRTAVEGLATFIAREVSQGEQH